MTMGIFLRICILLTVYISQVCFTQLPVVYYQLDLLIILDSHSGVQPTDWLVEKQFASNIVDSFRAIGPCSTKVAVMNYGSDVVLNWNFKSPNTMNRTALIHSINELAMVGGDMGSLVPVLNMASKDVFGSDTDRPEVPNLVILINSMSSESNGLATAAENLKSLATVVVFGVTSATDFGQLKTIASQSHLVLSVNEFDTLSRILDKAGIVTTECDALCVKGFTNKNINFNSVYKIELKKKSNTVPLDQNMLNKLFSSNETLRVSPKENICIKDPKNTAFYVNMLCMTTKFVKKVQIRGFVAGGKIIWKAKGKISGCKTFRIKKRSLNLVESFCISFKPVEDHSGNMHVGEFSMKGCVDKS